ncbi:glycosyltransferase family 2 protein [Brevibacillus porteri]|uniref:Glucosyl-3-phosphoglycerate synthase n=2 Tax=Brevibacillus porteri TaxID=2126350 RepID=A0ABX5FU22_9BACL|nr:glycosyltransferase family 2 protein [Brevibacillus porteri]MED1797964.1 glycosyltransferase family 2 protein [Brevibacillus porteri]MED2132201.1 glycosyltransferase family 2 protein [Brevibacillus porteri]MED2893801.1 glycosyltransferase family 2 protein [Brevibacillus porteri]PSK11402.1 glycosyltransferase [Brevibacillus porteri]
MHGTAHLPKLIAVCKQLAPLEIIVISKWTLELGAGIRAVSAEDAENLFSWRREAAKHARGSVLLFLGEEQIDSLSGLQRFLFPILYGKAQVVLPQHDSRNRKMIKPQPIHSFSLLVNNLFGRSDLREASLLDTPHAMTREALSKIGVEQLAQPAQAHKRAVVGGLSITAQIIGTGTEERLFLPQLHGSLLKELSLYEKLVIAEQLDLVSHLPFRGGLSDGGRRRDLAENVSGTNRGIPVTQVGKWPLRQTSLYSGKTVSVIIPALNEAATIQQVIREVLRLEPVEIIVVVNGSDDQTAQLARECGATTVEFPYALGVDTGRAIGASLAKGDILLLVDADVIMTAHDLYPFVLACQCGVDVALNDVSIFLNQPCADNVFVACRQALNLALNRKDLGIGSMVTVPFALRREAVAPLGWPILLCPPKAQAVYAQAGVKMELVHQVNSFSSNRLRPEKHFASSGMPPAVEQIAGDHVEAMQFLVKGR